MHRRALVPGVLVIVVAALVAGPVAAGDGDAYTGATFKRVTLVVSDMERSLTLYRDVLGFDLDEVSESTKESYSYPVFNIDPAATIRFATLSAGDKQVRTLALVEVKGMELPAHGTPHMTASVIRVDDLDATIEKVEALGLETVEPKLSGRPGEFTFKEQALVDFDGHLVVLYQILEVAGG